MLTSPWLSLVSLFHCHSLSPSSSSIYLLDIKQKPGNWCFTNTKMCWKIEENIVVNPVGQVRVWKLEWGWQSQGNLTSLSLTLRLSKLLLLLLLFGFQISQTKRSEALISHEPIHFMSHLICSLARKFDLPCQGQVIGNAPNFTHPISQMLSRACPSIPRMTNIGEWKA